MNYYINIYILVYKVKKFPERWIVKYSDNYSELKNIIRHVNYDEKFIGNYYIIKRVEKESILNEKFKKFQIYKNLYNDKLLY